MPKVFISYSHDSISHREKAVKLSNRLRQDGVDASIDAYVLHPAEGWPKWMEAQLRLDFVVIILSPKYVESFNQETGASSGAQYEGGIISALLLQKGLRFENIAVVCFDDWKNIDIPPVLFGCTRCYVDRQGEYKKLYAFLTGQVLVEKPPLGNLIVLKPGAQSFLSPDKRSFSDLCRSLWPLMEDNRRIFEDFGPNSGAAHSGAEEKIVRHDLSLWRSRRPAIGVNNELIAKEIRSYADVIPEAHEKLFRKWLSHIEAFAAHLADDDVDYREHQFPRQVVEIIKEHL